MLERVSTHPAITPERDVTRQHVLVRDYECRGRLDLRKVGAHRYASDPDTSVLCAAYATDSEPVKLWTPGDAVPPEFVEAANNPGWITVAHHTAFEMAIERHILGPRVGWPLIPIEQQRDTMAMALAMSLPARLETVARALELKNQKDMVGHRLMLMMSKPRKPRKDEDPGKVHWFEGEDRLARLYEYCRQDVEVERELFGRLRPLSDSEQALWALDAVINQRGFQVDRALAEAARKIAQAAGPEIDAELAEVTGGMATSVNQIAKLMAWMEQQGSHVKDLRQKTVQELLETAELPPKVRRAVELRQDGGQAAVKKISKLLEHADADGRVRGSLQFHRASTGRWGGQGPQPQNMKRPEVEDIGAAISAVATGSHEHVRSLYPRTLALLGDLGRSLIVAAPGHVLIGADFSAIESRVLAWAANEEWKVESYRRFDATQDPKDEVYCATAGRIFRVPPGTYTKDSPQRAVGKTCDLAFGYMGGLAAWRKFEPDRFTDAEVEQFKAEWRAAHPNIKNFWYALDRAAWAAVRDRGRVVPCGPVVFKCDGAFLFLKLPSGRKLAYPVARNKQNDAQHGVVLFADNSAGRWHDCRGGRGSYGGVWTENVVQAIARDLLTGAMQRVEAAGYPIVLHVHDEIVAEVPEGFGSPEEFTKLMTRKPAWALTLPIAATAWAGQRFR